MKNISQTQRWVIKVGSSLITAGGRGLDREAIRRWADQVAALRQQGRELLLVSSGAVAEGMARLGWKRRPHAIHELQAAAAVGQMGLVQAYESQLQHHGIHSAQVLLTHDDLSDRRRYLNARSTLCTLMRMGVVPVINENDTVAIEEIRLGDNDTLAALVANLVEAELLVILTDQGGLYDKDPGLHPDARRIAERRANDRELDAYAGPSAGSLGRGGMITKVLAARRAARSGTATLIADGNQPDILLRIAGGESAGTLLLPDAEPMTARKQWLAGHLRVAGSLELDAGAARVLRESGASLLPVGVTGVTGQFKRGEVVACLDPDGREVARGLVNYGAEDARKIVGRPSGEIESLLGYVVEPELIHRDNLVLLGQ